MKTVYLSTAYLGPVEYYRQFEKYDKVVIESHCNYIKQTYRNRCRIETSRGIQTLSIPVKKQGNLKCSTKDILISEHGEWRHRHWHAIVSAYNSSPYFEYYEDYFRPFYEKRYKYLFEFNESLRELICKLADIRTIIEYSREYKKDFKPEETDLREKIHPKKDNYEHSFKPYYQVFSEKFGFG